MLYISSILTQGCREPFNVTTCNLFHVHWQLRWWKGAGLFPQVVSVSPSRDVISTSRVIFTNTEMCSFLFPIVCFYGWNKTLPQEFKNTDSFHIRTEREKFYLGLEQGSSTRGPRAAYDPPVSFVQPEDVISQNTMRYEYWSLRHYSEFTQRLILM